MASTRSSFSPPNFILTPQQQSLLFAALTSNRAQPQQNNAVQSLTPQSLTKSPAAKVEGSAVQESPFLDYDFDFPNDSTFDFDFSNTSANNAPSNVDESMAGDADQDNDDDDDEATSPVETDSPDKRGHPDDDAEEGGGKRRESAEKVAKKPGRKPLTSEPSSKRKAQNRAAQRAFRERKERHLKDLETKVQDLEKQSEQASHENARLRAQVEKMSVEITEYKKRVSSINNNRSASAGSSVPHTFGQSVINNLSDVNFHFEFPKFGVLPGPSPSPSAPSVKSPPPQRQSSMASSAAAAERKESVDAALSPAGSTNGRNSLDGNSSSNNSAAQLNGAAGKDELAKYSGLFSPPLTGTVVANASRSSVDSGPYSNGANSTSSPSASSASNMGPSSSCGTSPEPFSQSPMGFKPVDTLTTIGEEQPGVNDAQAFGHFVSNNVSSFDWLSQQNGGQFDPQLFGGFREPQESILANQAFDDSFFNDAFDMDFTTPYNVAPSPFATKKDLIAEIDAKQNEDDEDMPAEVKEKYLTCNKIWEKLQTCPKVQSGDFDLDGLCSELQKKAKCSGSGAVVDEKEFSDVMKKYLGKDGKEVDCTV